MIERDPLRRDHAADRLRASGELRYLAASEHLIQEARIERELDELDDAVVGMTGSEMRRLREWSEGLDRLAAEARGRTENGTSDLTKEGEASQGARGQGKQSQEDGRK